MTAKNIIRLLLLTLFVFLSSASLFAEKKYIYTWGRKWSTTDEKKFDLEKNSASITIPHVWCGNRIDFCNTLSMARGTDQHDYNVNTGSFNRGDIQAC